MAEPRARGLATGKVRLPPGVDGTATVPAAADLPPGVDGTTTAIAAADLLAVPEGAAVELEAVPLDEDAAVLEVVPDGCGDALLRAATARATSSRSMVGKVPAALAPADLLGRLRLAILKHLRKVAMGSTAELINGMRGPLMHVGGGNVPSRHGFRSPHTDAQRTVEVRITARVPLISATGV